MIVYRIYKNLPRIQRFVQMLLCILYFPFDVNWCVSLNITLYMHLFAFGDRNLFVFRCKMRWYCKLNEHTQKYEKCLSSARLCDKKTSSQIQHISTSVCEVRRKNRMKCSSTLTINFQEDDLAHASSDVIFRFA